MRSDADLDNRRRRGRLEVKARLFVENLKIPCAHLVPMGIFRCGMGRVESLLSRFLEMQTRLLLLLQKFWPPTAAEVQLFKFPSTTQPTLQA